MLVQIIIDSRKLTVPLMYGNTVVCKFQDTRSWLNVQIPLIVHDCSTNGHTFRTYNRPVARLVERGVHMKYMQASGHNIL